MNVVHFGAGNIGKGLIGYILSLNQCCICFVDVNENIINQLNSDKNYLIKVLEDSPKIITIENVSGVLCESKSNSLREKFLDADLITTSVGINNLARIAPILLSLLNARVKIGKPIDIIANENAINASSRLANEIKILAGDNEFSVLTKYCSFVNSAIDRQAITTMHNGKSITTVEPFFEWVINGSELINKQLLQFNSIKFVSELTPYIEKKLYIANLGHCATAYLGAFIGKLNILDTLAIPSFKTFIHNTMAESAGYLHKQYSFSLDELTNYIDNTLYRFANPHLIDSVTRVGASPIRKLGSNERIIGPLKKLYKHKLPYQHLVTVVALALFFNIKEDEQSQQIQVMLSTKGINNSVASVTGLNDPYLIEEISERYLDLYKLIKTNKTSEDLTRNLMLFLQRQG